MAVDTATYPSTLNVALPADGDTIAEGDDNFRHVKTVLKAAMPNVASAISATGVELSYVAGVTSALQTQINAKSPTASPTFTGTPAAPTAAAATNTTQLATTAMVQAAVAGAVSGSGALTLSVSNAAAVTLTAGQQDASAYAGVVTWTTPPAPAVGDRCGVIVCNGRTDNVINFNGLKHQGLSDATITLNSAYASPTLRYVSTAYGWSIV